jgi:hypothetical protein
MDDLTLQVGEIHLVVVAQRDAADTAGSKISDIGEPSPPAPITSTCAA